VLAAAGLALAALSFPLIEAGARLGLRLGSTAAAVVSNQLGVSILVIAVVVVLTALLTLPLARWR
jgi:hypothetical protein